MLLRGGDVVRMDSIPVIFITGHGDIPMAVRAIESGAVEFLSKPFRDQDLLDAIGQALERDAGERLEADRLRALREAYETLTPREKEVLALLVGGGLNKQIAARLGVAEVTIKVHRHNIMKKMCVRSMVSLARIFEELAI